MDGAEEKVSVGLSKREIRESPGIEADTPVSRQNEIALADHFRWPRYWETLSTGEPMLPLIPPLPREPAAVPPTAADVEIPRGDPNLRSAVEDEGYHVAARDGEIRHIDDFLVDDTGWSLRFLVTSPPTWLPGRQVLVALAWRHGLR